MKLTEEKIDLLLRAVAANASTFALPCSETEDAERITQAALQVMAADPVQEA